MSSEERDVSGNGQVDMVDRSEAITHILIKAKEEKSITNDTRIPLIVVHGVDGNNNDVDPYFKAGTNGTVEGKEKQLNFLIDEENGYFQNLNLLLNEKSLKSKYRVYYYSYPSQKHISYNGRKLKELIKEIPYLQNKKIVFLAHSMGGLVVRYL